MAMSSARISSSFQKNVISQFPALETSKQTSALGHVFQAVHTMQFEQPNECCGLRLMECVWLQCHDQNQNQVLDRSIHKERKRKGNKISAKFFLY
jgi:hypothetical protein